MRRLAIFAWFLLLLVWIGMRFNAKVYFRERFQRHHCQLEWRGPFGILSEHKLICPETGKVVGEYYESTGIWRASSSGCWDYLSEDFATEQQAKQAVEKCQ